MNVDNTNKNITNVTYLLLFFLLAATTDLLSLQTAFVKRKTHALFRHL
jgi:hypothetical protein